MSALLLAPDAATSDRLCRCYLLAVARHLGIDDPQAIWEVEQFQARSLWVVALRRLEHVTYEYLAVFCHSRADVVAAIYNRHGARWSFEVLDAVRARARAIMAEADPAKGVGILVSSDDDEVAGQ